MNDPRFLKNLAGRSGVFVAAAMAGVLGGAGVTYVDSAGGLKTDTTLKFDDTTETLTVGDPATTTRIIIDDGGTIWTGGNTAFQLGTNGAGRFTVATLAFYPNSDNALDLGLTGTNDWRDIFLQGEVDFTQEADPSAPGATRGAVYAKSLTSATYLTARFPTGNVQIVAGEPFSVQTADATVTTCLTVAIPTNAVLYAEVMATGYQSGGNNAAGYLKGATFKNVAGTVTQVGATSLTNEHESNAAWDFAASISGTNVLWRVTGVAATTIDWDCTINRMNASP